MRKVQVELKNPQVTKFIDEQVKAGRFRSAQAAVEAAVKRMILDQEGDELDDQTIAAINRAEDQIARGEGIDFHRFADDMRKRISKA